MSTPDRSASEGLDGELDLALLADIPDPLGLASGGLAGEHADAASPSKDDRGKVDRARAKMSAEPHALTRAEVRTRRWIALGLSTLWLVAFVGILGLRRDLSSQTAAVMGHVVVPGALGAFALYLALAPGRLGLGSRIGWLKGATIAAPIAFAAFAALGASSFDLREPSFFLHAFVCGAVSLVLAVIPMVAAAVGLRRVCVTAAPWRSALVGVGIGLAGASTLGLHCTEGGGFHVLIGHVTPVLLLAFLAMVFVRRFARAD